MRMGVAASPHASCPGLRGPFPVLLIYRLPSNLVGEIVLNTYINSQVIKIGMMVIKKINGGHQKIKERTNS